MTFFHAINDIDCTYDYPLWIDHTLLIICFLSPRLRFASVSPHYITIDNLECVYVTKRGPLLICFHLTSVYSVELFALCRTIIDSSRQIKFSTTLSEMRVERIRELDIFEPSRSDTT